MGDESGVLSADGRESVELPVGSRVRIRAVEPSRAALVRRDDAPGFLSLVREKFGLPGDDDDDERRRCRLTGQYPRVLHELHIAGLGVIDDLDLALHPGLNVLTGETGAGKTMVTTGLTLALGAVPPPRWCATAPRPRGSRPGSTLRTTRTTGPRTARSSSPGPSRPRARARRGSPANWPRRPRWPRSANDLVEVHGQHQAQRLLSPVTQTAFLDRFAGDEHLVALAAYREAFDALRSSRGRARPVARGRTRPRARTRPARLPGAGDRGDRPSRRARPRRSRVKKPGSRTSSG